MKLKIYNQSGALKLTAATSSSSTWNNELMTENAVSASFTHFAFVPLEVNDYILLEGVKFSIKKEYKPKQKNRQTYSYSVKFYAPIHDAEQVMYLNLTDGQYEPQFSLDGSPREHLQKWVENMNRIYGEERWQIGDVVDAPNQTVEYSNTSCWDSLGSIAEAFETEWWSDGFYINLCRCERGERISLGYMQGLTSLTQSENTDDVKFFTRLIPLGSTRNIDRSRYGFSRLQLPDRAKYIDRNTQYGLYEHVESEAFAGIYPHYTGTVASVRTEEKTGDDGKPFTIYYFKDSGMAFDPCENEIGGLVKHVSFQTGDLAGRDFEANYDSKAKEWEIINLYPDENTQIPGGNLIPVIGDTYIPWNFRMPVEYETQAEKDYKAAVDNFLAKYSEDIAKYGGDTDYTYIDRNAVPLILGQSVRLLSDEYFPGTGHRDSRMTKVVRKLDNLSIATIECTNQVGKGWRKQVDDSLNNLQYVVGETLDRAVIDVLKTWDSKEPSNYNVFSALRAIKEITERAISKLGPDETKYLVKFLGGLISDNIESQEFSSGPFGSGYLLKRDPKTGKSYFEVDEMYVRLKAYFDTLEVKHLSHVGGRIVLSPASMECVMVAYSTDGHEVITDIDNSVLTDSESRELMALSDVPDGVYRCYFKTTDGDTTIVNEFVVGDQAQCREFNIKAGVHENVTNQYYWRKVVGIGDDYIDLSVDDCDTGSMVPKAGDTIVTVGNKTDVSRQNVIILSTVGDDAPSIKQYAGIDDYSMAGKEVTVLSPKGNKIAGQFVIQAGSTGGENLDDMSVPDLTEIKEQINTAKDSAVKAQKAADSAKVSVSDLNTYVDGAFSDGIIEESEAKAIEKYINVVKSSKSDMEATYNKLYTNPYLEGDAKTDLLNAKITFFGAVDSLLSSINTAIADGKTTVGKKNDVDAKYAVFNSAYADFTTAIETANKAIQDKLNSYSATARQAAELAQEIANSAKTAAVNANKAVGDLNAYVDGAFADGIITEAEAKAIEKYINTVNGTKSSVEAAYNKLYVNAHLTGAAKTGLLNAKVTLMGSIENLIKSINTAISNGKTTVGEKNDVDAKYAVFNSAYADFTTAIETANKAIQDKLKEYTDTEVNKVKTRIGNIPVEVKDAVARNLGYSSYSDLESAAEAEQTIISGGKINTQLIEATAIITAQLIADAISANALDVGGRFKVGKNGITELVDAVVSGTVRSAKEGRRVEFNPSNGSLDLYSDNRLWGTVGWSGNYPKVLLYGKSTGIYTEITANKIIFNNLSGAINKELTSLTIDLTNFQKTPSITNGVLYSGDDGIVRIKDGDFVAPVDTYEVILRASPENGGTVTGGGVREEESIGTISAMPNSGYIFSHWSDGDKNASRSITWDGNKELTAYFVAVYTVALKVSPSGAGTVSGGGVEEAGTTGNINASANSGYTFERWSDGETRASRSITWDGNKELTAYFVAYVPSTTNILTLGSTGNLLTEYKDDNASFAPGWFASQLTGNLSSTDGNTASVIFSLNKGLLTGKIKAGLKYRLKFNCHGTTESGSVNKIAYILGTLDDTSPENLGGVDAIGGVIEFIDFSNGSGNKKTYTFDFTAQKTSTDSDALCFAVVSNRTGGGIMITDISLMEI